MKISKVLTKSVATVSTIASSVFLSATAFAQNAGSYLGGVTGASSSSLPAFIQSALNLVISLSALIAVGILVYSGIQYIIAAGDENKVEKATKGITYAVVGLIICFISVLIVNFVLTNLLKVS